MDRKIVFSSYSVKTGNNKPGNFTTKFTRPITLYSNVQYAIGLKPNYQYELHLVQHQSRVQQSINQTQQRQLMVLHSQTLHFPLEFGIIVISINVLKEITVIK